MATTTLTQTLEPPPIVQQPASLAPDSSSTASVPSSVPNEPPPSFESIQPLAPETDRAGPSTQPNPPSPSSLPTPLPSFDPPEAGLSPSDPDVVAAVERLGTRDDTDPYRELYHGNVPMYSEQGLTNLDDAARAALGLPLTTIHRDGEWSPAEWARYHIATEWTKNVADDKRDVVLAFVQNGLVSPDLADGEGITALGTAARHGHLAMARLLIELGATVDLVFLAPRKDDGYFDLERHTRTALLVAAQYGHIAMVKFLMSKGADDGFLASDGQLALRLAADNGHDDIVDFLPARRGGALLRWKTHNAKMLRGIFSILRVFYYIGKVFLWYIPKFFLFDIPWKILKRVGRGIKYSYENVHKFPGWCKRQVERMGNGIKRMGKGIKRAAKELPGKVKHAAKAIARAARAAPVVIRDFVVKSAKAFADAMVYFAKFIAKWTRKFGSAVWNIIALAASAVFTALAAVVSFIARVRNVTFADVKVAFKALGNAFLFIPRLFMRFIEALCDIDFKHLAAVITDFGAVVWKITWILIRCLLWFPEQIIKIFIKLGSIGAKGFHEIMVVINPKWK